MKKIALSLIIIFLPILAHGESIEIDGIYYNLIAKVKQAEVTSNPQKYKGIIIIPEKVNYEGMEYIVKKIADNAFNDCYNLNSVTIPNSVTSIGNYAFQYCI